jgi:probable F420-dependent oxidoreductase
MPLDVSRIGLSTPGLLLQPGAHSPWEVEAPFSEIARVVQAADRLGFHHVTCAEHAGVPASQAPRRGARYFEALAAFGYFAAVTSRIRFATSVLVLAYHHPLALAKQYGSLDVINGGRTILGLGVGTLKEEFDALGLGGAEFAERGARADDALRALRAALGRREPAYRGRYYEFSGLVVDPCAAQAHMPMWIGGQSARSLRRAVELADGWMPFGLDAEALAALVAEARKTPAWAARPQPLEIVLSTGTGLDPLGAPDDAARRIAALQAAGASIVQARVNADSADHYIEQLERLAAFDA